ncbi:MAG TPA: hypothetical protein VEJ19_04795 [Nitrososphaerales archaeon]|nr:hypothetical protein [Nitrososphaerales archaeon]
MFSRIAVIGLAVFVVGVVIGAVGVATPLATASQQPATLINAAITVDPNDYATQSLIMTAGQSAQVALRIENQTIFTFDIMNQTQYDIWYSCAPRCHQPLLGGNGTYYEQANEKTPTLVNATVSPSSPYMALFVVPSNATYYFVLDNSVGPTWADYLNQDASGSTVGQLTLTSTQAGTDYSINWLLVGLGSVVILVGGGIATWSLHPKRKPSE